VINHQMPCTNTGASVEPRHYHSWNKPPLEWNSKLGVPALLGSWVIARDMCYMADFLWQLP